MKLSKLYCNESRFKNIRFNLDGLNIVYADVQSRKEEKKNSHDLGKTKLAELIDFMFLKEIDNQSKHFLFRIKNDLGKSIFNDYEFYLEILTNSGKYLTIKRSVSNNTKISFSLDEKRTEDFIPPKHWDLESVSIKKAKQELNRYLLLDFFFNKAYDYRKAINYSLRMQGDFDDVYRLSKYAVGKDIDWKPFVFDLLGFKGELLIRKYENDLQRDRIASFVESLKKEYSIRIEDRDDIVAQMKLVEINSIEVEKEIDAFNFYEQDKELVKKGIDEIETKISDLNTDSYNLNYEIDRLNKSIDNKFAFNLEKVKKVFEEASVYFPESLQNDYNALISFNNKLTVERNKLLSKTLIEKKQELLEVNSKLQELNNQKEKLLSYLSDTDTFRKFKYYQKELVKIEGQLIALKEKLKNIDLIIEKEKESSELLKQIESTIEEIRTIHQQTENNQRYSDIRAKFSSFYKKIMDEDARIFWKINTNNNVDFIPPKVHSKGLIKKETAKDEGNTYKKILCVAFDLAILCSYNHESYFRFVYHDDVLSQQDNGIKNRFLELLKDILTRYDLQYILSVIKSDLPFDEEEKFQYFPEENIILKLHDRDQSGTLFGFEF